jgi:hypothetical protein
MGNREIERRRVTMVKWTELQVSDSDDKWGSLGELVNKAPANLDNADIIDGRIDSWPGMFIAAPGEEPDYDTPTVPVDWTGFQAALDAVRGRCDD